MRKERLLIWIGRKLVPKTIRYWIIVNAFAEASFRYDIHPDDLGFSKVVQ